MSKIKIISGIQPSGTLHLGNYLGAIKPWINILNKNFSNFNLENNNNNNKDNNNNTLNTYSPNKENTLFFIADLHSLTSKLSSKNTSLETSENLSLQTLAMLIASGLDTNKSTIFLQSTVPYNTELQWILSCTTPLSLLNTMPQFKEKKINTAGLYNYPLLMSADVLLYKATHVPVGSDNEQNMELMRKITDKINYKVNQDLYKTPIYLPSKNNNRIMSLTTSSKKMSKSVGGFNSCIYITDTKEDISKKILKAKSDSIGSILYDVENRPEISNLINIYSGLTNKTIDEIEIEFKDKNTYEFKKELVNICTDVLIPIQERYIRLVKHEQEYLYDVLRQGKKEANKQASENMEELKEKLNMLNVI